MTLEEAIRWRKIKDFPNYSISELGDVRNDITGKLKKIQYDKYGYKVVGLYNHQKRKEFKIHRLIAECFIPNSDNKPCINHINGIKDDNRIENLEWCTFAENNYHAWNTLDSKNRRRIMAMHAHNRVWTKESREKLSKLNKGRKHTAESRKRMSESRKGKDGNHKTPIVCIETGIVYPSIKRASDDMGILSTSICNVLSGYSKSANGYHFRKAV